MTFTKEQIQEQEDKVEVLRYRKEDLYNKYLEASDKFQVICFKLNAAVIELNGMKTNVNRE